jgi:hypothetical protein
MKRHATQLAVVLAATLFAAAAQAQALTSPPQRTLRGAQIPLTKASVILYAQLTNARSADAPAWAAVTGMPQATVEKFLAHARTSIEAIHDEENTQRLKLVCGQRKAITTPAQLTAALVRIDANVEVTRAQLVQDSAKVLGVAGKRQVDDYVLKMRQEIAISEMDPEKVVQYGLATGQTVAGIVAKLCPDA